MKKFIVYFHGYNSSPETEKVKILKEAFPDDYVYCFQANVDPEIAQKTIEEKIDSALLDHMHEDLQVIFIGTSLGGWLAAKFGNVYEVKTILINPVYDPKESLKKYEVAEDIRNKYTQLKIDPKAIYFVSENDEFLDHSILLEKTKNMNNCFSDKFSDHRYGEPHFSNRVIEYIKSQYDYCW